MSKIFPKDCWGNGCQYFHVVDMSVDDLLCIYDLLDESCDACDGDFSFTRCPIEGKMPLEEE